MQYLAENQMNM